MYILLLVVVLTVVATRVVVTALVVLLEVVAENYTISIAYSVSREQVTHWFEMLW